MDPYLFYYIIYHRIHCERIVPTTYNKTHGFSEQDILIPDLSLLRHDELFRNPIQCKNRYENKYNVSKLFITVAFTNAGDVKNKRFKFLNVKQLFGYTTNRVYFSKKENPMIIVNEFCKHEILTDDNHSLTDNSDISIYLLLQPTKTIYSTINNKAVDVRTFK